MAIRQESLHMEVKAPWVSPSGDSPRGISVQTAGETRQEVLTSPLNRPSQKRELLGALPLVAQGPCVMVPWTRATECNPRAIRFETRSRPNRDLI